MGRRSVDERQLLSRVAAYVPPHWVRRALANPERPLAGIEDRIYAVVLFADISGFTPMSEALSRRGREGIEELSEILDRYFEAMSESVLAFGGEVVKFAGDSLIVLFPVQADGGDAHLGAALHCSLQMQAAMAEFSEVYTSAGVFPLRMKIGMGEGAIYTTTVGDEEKGIQSVFAGRPLTRSIQAEDMASPGEIVADAALISRMPGRLDIGEARGTFRLIAGASDVPALPPIDRIDFSNLDPERARLLVHRLVPYLPSQIVERLRQGQPGAISEHRTVTIMFVKFGGLNYDLESEVGRVLQLYFTTMRDCVQRYGGRLNEVDIVADGGTLVVFFGAPTAHEDDEVRAVRCAWEMQQAIAEVRLAAGASAEGLRQCIGVSSGSVFVGDVGATVRRTYTAVGDEVNLASRLMNLAHWGEVVVTSWVQEQAAGRYDFEAMGQVKLKGKAEPVPLYALLAPRQQSGAGGVLAELMGHRSVIGRTAELATMRDVLGRALRGEPQFLLVAGEAGVGKSVLIATLAREWTERGGTVCAGDCQGQVDAGAYGLWISLLRSALHLDERGGFGEQRERIESQLLVLSPTLGERAQLLGALLPEASASASPVALLSTEHRTKVHQAVIDLFRTLALRQPLFLAIENLHDIDAASQELLSETLSSLEGLSVLACGIYRPRENLDIPSGPIATTQIVLDALSAEDSLVLAESLLRDANLSLSLAPELVEQARGNPFYLQEMVRALADFADPAVALARRMVIPESLSDTILAELDPLGEEYRLTLRIAAVMGQLFSFDVLRAAYPIPISRHGLATRLARLERMHVVRMDHFGDEIIYRFRYTITQRVIYASMHSTDRERYHCRVGEALERVYAGDMEGRYELLADHFARGGMPTKAIAYLLLAGERAAQANAVREALSHFRWAEEILSVCYTCSPRCSQGVQLRLLLQRGEVQLRLAQTTQAEQDLQAALLIAGDLADQESQSRAQVYLAEIALGRADYARALGLLMQGAQRCSALEKRRELVAIWLQVSRLHALQGELENARRYINRALRLQEGLRDRLVAARCKSWQATLDFASGQRIQVADTLKRAIAWGRRERDLEVVAESLFWLVEVHLRRGNWGEALQVARQAVTACQESADRLRLAIALRILALALVQIGAYEEAIDYLDEAMRVFVSAGRKLDLAYGYRISGDALLALGRYEQSAERFSQALALARAQQTVKVTVLAQLGLSKLAAVGHEWAEGERLCTEARARAREANLADLVVAARLGLARVYLARAEWRSAQREASQALDASYRLRCPYDTFRAAAMMGEALKGLDQLERAHRYFVESHTMIQRLADTLPTGYRELFLGRRYVRIVIEYAVGGPSGLDSTPRPLELAEADVGGAALVLE